LLLLKNFPQRRNVNFIKKFLTMGSEIKAVDREKLYDSSKEADIDALHEFTSEFSGLLFA